MFKTPLNFFLLKTSKNALKQAFTNIQIHYFSNLSTPARMLKKPLNKGFFCICKSKRKKKGRKRAIE